MEWLLEALALLAGFLFALLPANTIAYIAPPLLPEQQEVRILFAGDIMLDRSIRVAMEKHGDDFIFSCIADTLREADVVVANLEGPITTNASVSVGSTPGDSNNFTFTFPSSSADLLYRHNIRIVNLGNNHILNFGRDGLRQTREYLARAGVQYFGDPDEPERDRVLRTELDGIPVSFVNWSDWTSDKTDHTVAQVRKEREAGRIVIVYTHWGEEYVAPTERVRALAHQFVDAGAEIVIGSHPHVVQENELYKGKHIYYSLGNFVFDQYWMASVRSGLLLEVVLGKSGVAAVREIPVTLERDRRTCLTDAASSTPGLH